MSGAKKQIDIERLITWALRDQGLGWVSSGGDSVLGGQFAALGTIIDKSTSYGLPPPGIGYHDHEDALLVRRAIERIKDDAAGLILIHGRCGTRPDWGEEGYGLPEQIVGGNGQKKWLYNDPVNRRGKIGPMLDWRAYDAHVRQIDFERTSWTLWREGLLVLRDVLSGKLLDHVTTGPAVMARPWERLADEGPVDIPYRHTLNAARDRAKGHNAVPRDWSVENSRTANPQKTGAST